MEYLREVKREEGIGLGYSAGTEEVDEEGDTEVVEAAPVDEVPVVRETGEDVFSTFSIRASNEAP